jgi:hypothetical protein
MAEGDNILMVTESGEFTPVFREHVAAEHPDSKVFDDVKDIKGLTKAYVDTKTAHGKMNTDLTAANEALAAANTKMETGLFPLGEKADDTAKAEYARRLASLNGFDGNADNYKLPRIEGVEYGDAEVAAEKATVEMAIANGIPPAVVNKFTEFHNAVQSQLIADEMAKFKADAAKFDTDFAGDAKPEALRQVYQALDAFASEELKAQIKEAGLFDSDDLALWNKFVPLETIRIFKNVHDLTMAGGEIIGSGVKPNLDGVHPDSEYAKAVRAFPGQPEMWEGQSKDAPTA